MAAISTIFEQTFRRYKPNYRTCPIENVPLEKLASFGRFYFDPKVDAETVKAWMLGNLSVPSTVQERFLYLSTVWEEEVLELVEQCSQTAEIEYLPLYSSVEDFMYFEPDTCQRFLGSYNWHTCAITEAEYRVRLLIGQYKTKTWNLRIKGYDVFLTETRKKHSPQTVRDYTEYCQKTYNHIGLGNTEAFLEVFKHDLPESAEKYNDVFRRFCS